MRAKDARPARTLAEIDREIRVAIERRARHEERIGEIMSELADKLANEISWSTRQTQRIETLLEERQRLVIS